MYSRFANTIDFHDRALLETCISRLPIVKMSLAAVTQGRVLTFGRM